MILLLDAICAVTIWALALLAGGVFWRIVNRRPEPVSLQALIDRERARRVGGARG